MRSDKPYNGVFVPTEISGSGHLSIAGKDTVLKLVTTLNLGLNDPEFQDLHGSLVNGKKASALQCVLKNRVRHGVGKTPLSDLTYFSALCRSRRDLHWNGRFDYKCDSLPVRKCGLFSGRP